MPSPVRNGDHNVNNISPRIPSPAGTPHHRHRHHLPHFHPTASDHKLRRLNSLILLLRFAAFCFSLAAAIFMAANAARSPGSPAWQDFELFRFVLAANAIVAVYSLAETVVAIWEILRGTTPLPESLQLWFDFSHDQLFAYLLLAAEAAGTGEARNLRKADTCTVEDTFCIQAYISVALGFVGFPFLAISALISGYRLVSYSIVGSRFHF